MVQIAQMHSLFKIRRIFASILQKSGCMKNVCWNDEIFFTYSSDENLGYVWMYLCICEVCTELSVHISLDFLYTLHKYIHTYPIFSSDGSRRRCPLKYHYLCINDDDDTPPKHTPLMNITSHLSKQCRSQFSVCMRVFSTAAP